MTRILICEDEPLIAKRLVRFIESSIGSRYEIELVHTQSQAFQVLAQRQIDLLFLDLNLHGRDGFEILKKLTSEAFQTVVVSAYTDRAMEAFEIGVLDFIGKPFTQERVQKAIDRYFKEANPQNDHLSYLSIQTPRGIDFVDIGQIAFIKAASIYSELVLLDGSVRIYNKPLNQLLKLLPAQFFRLHKSYISRIDHIKSIEQRQTNTYDAVLLSGQRIPVSREARKELIRQLTN